MKKETTSANVHIIDEAFYIPQLDRYRRIWLYLPADYDHSEEEYPVIYMHDGQNLFEEWSAFGQEWGVDETLDELQAKCIVVGIDNGGEHRLNEYNIYDHPQFGKGEGRQYLEFIKNELKPFIDNNYRTLEDRASTWIVGSSMGGLISLYAALYYPGTFGGAGIFSPSIQLNDTLIEEVKEQFEKERPPQRLYMYAGIRESEEMAAKIQAIEDHLSSCTHCDICAAINEEGEHTEENWRHEFKRFYLWTFPKS
jgi:predicted alpha/beta superfamily hydrolase